MPVHTFEIRKTYCSKNPSKELKNLLQEFGFTDDVIYKLINLSTKKAGARRSLISDYPSYGLEEIDVFRISEEKYRTIYHIILRINPSLMCFGTNGLFTPSPENNKILCNAFWGVMYDFTHDEDFRNLSSWECRRIDYTLDHVFETQQEAKLFDELCHKSSKLNRRKLKRMQEFDTYEQSYAEGNKRSKVIVYDKNKEVREHYENVPEEDMETLLGGIGNRIRFEVQYYREKVNDLMNTYRLPNKSILNYLNEEIARRELKKAYDAVIGSGSYCSAYWAEKIINASHYGKAMKERLINFIHLIAKFQFLSIGRDKFLEGGQHIRRTEKEVKGTRPTFNKNIERLREINLNPIMIPRTRYNIKILDNPITDL